MLRRLILLVLVLAAAAGSLLAADWWFCLPEGETARYVGGRECARCHPQQMKDWTGSDHQLAMNPATAEFVLGNFDNQKFTHGDVTSTMFRRDGKFCITTDGPTGKLETFTIKYVFGIWPLQQYLVEFPDGRVQCLGVAWDAVQRRWFHLYPNEKIPSTDVLHWTKPLQNWNYMCAECHTTNLNKNYDLATNAYHTTWSEMNVSCETCHGPGSLHVKVADRRRFLWDRRYGYGLPRLKGEDSKAEIETCAPCHARRRIVAPNHRDGRPVPAYQKFLDYNVPEILDNGLYYADGQILDEDYEYTSFLQSKMYANNVRCSNCHDPHTLHVKFAPTEKVDPRLPARVKITDNRLCGQCHVPTTYDTPTHHHHPNAAKPGTLCVECHMPVTKYMVVDPRRDHSIRIPRPDLTVSLGIPNACNGCHEDKKKGETPAWAAAQCEKWYGKRRGPPHFAHAIAAGRQNKPEGERLLEAVTRRKDLCGVVRASSISLLSHYGSETAAYAANAGLEDPDGLVRATSIRSLEQLPPAELLSRLPPRLRDPLRAVRVEAARALSRVPREQMSEKDRQAFDAALAEYIAGQRSLDEQPGAHLSIAVVYANQGDVKRAEAEYAAALRLDPRFVPALVNLAMLYDAQGRKEAAVAEFRRALEIEPQMADVHYSLGLLLAEKDSQLAEAAEHLAAAVRLAPDNPRMHYNYGLAMQKLGKPDEAESQFSTAYKLAPQSLDYLHALAILYTQQKRWARAQACAEELIRRQPNNPDLQQLLEYVKHEAAAKEDAASPAAKP